MGLRLHSGRHFDTDACYGHWSRLSFRHRPKVLGDLNIAAPGLRRSRRSSSKPYGQRAWYPVPRSPAAHRSTMDTARDGRMDQLESHWHLGHIDAAAAVTVFDYSVPMEGRLAILNRR